jgi:hypothetical protein
VAAGYRVYAINPMSVARYRERHSTSGAKSDAGDAHVLAEIVRLDHAHHRPIAGDIPATGVSQTITKQDHEKCETRGGYVVVAGHRRDRGIGSNDTPGVPPNPRPACPPGG